MSVIREKIIKQQVVYIPTTKLSRAQRFYAKVFCFDISAYTHIQDSTGEEWSIFPLTIPSRREGKPIPTGFFFLGLGHSPQLVPSQHGTIPFLPCDDIDETLGRVEKYGGKILQSKATEQNASMDIHQKVEVSHAFFLDSEGNKIGLTHGKVTFMTPTM